MVCRLCFSETEEVLDIFSEEQIFQCIKKFLEIEIIKQDPISRLICNSCWHHLKDFQDFYTQIKEAQKRPLMKFKKEIVSGDKELGDEMEDSTFDGPDINEALEISMQTDEQIVPDNYDDFKSDADPSPDHLNKKSRHSKTLSKTTRSFKNENERKFFVELMKKEEVIWNRTHTLHSSSRALGEAWKRIAHAMLTPKTVHECKVMWKSLRDALRYERRKAASGCDQSHDLRNLLYFISASNGQKRSKNLPVRKLTDSDETLSKNPGKSKPGTREKYKIQNYHVFDSSNAPWSDRTGENSVSDLSAYSEGPPKHNSSNSIPLEGPADRPHSTSGICTSIPVGISNSMGIMNEPPSGDYKSHSNAYYGDVKNEFKDEVSELVGSISKALNRLVTIATNKVNTKSNTDFKYEYIWKLIECLYAQMDQSTINDMNQKIINMVYEGCKISVY